MTATQADKANQFRALHEASEAFVIANVGSIENGVQTGGVPRSGLTTDELRKTRAAELPNL
jgi:hypothetical protein